MGGSHSKSHYDATTLGLEEMSQDYQTSVRFLSTLVKSRPMRRMLAQLKGDEAQTMADFLNRVLERKDLEGIDVTNVVHTLASLSRTAQVFPHCLQLDGVTCNFDPRLHVGTFGEIFKGGYKAQVVCVKAIRNSSPEYTREQILRVHAKEAILSAHMRHESILPFYGIYFCPDKRLKYCIISPWMEYGDLSEYLQSRPEAPRIPLIHDIIRGLKYMHDHNMVHSDLKVTNMLVSKEGRAVLGDFGSSRLTSSTMTSTATGDGYWMAPELLNGGVSNATKACDIWSFACTCYQVFSGTKPFYECKDVAALGNYFHFAKGNVFPTRSPKIDEIAWNELKKCWSWEPRNRPTAFQLQQFFSDLNVNDERPPVSWPNFRARPDRTKIDDKLVLKLLQEARAVKEHQPFTQQINLPYGGSIRGVLEVYQMFSPVKFTRIMTTRLAIRIDL